MTQTTSSALHRLPATERPRERLYRLGARHLTTSELLAICLGSGSGRHNVLGVAQQLLADFGSLDAILQATDDTLRQVSGLGPAKVALLKAMHELTLRHSEELLQSERGGDLFADAATVSRYVQRRIGHAEREVFACLYLDTRHRLLRFEEVFFGSVNRAHVYPREVLRRALQLNAAALILAHNHPSGVAEPSQADLAITRELVELLGRVDVKVLDHIVVAAHQTVSLAARGLLRS